MIVFSGYSIYRRKSQKCTASTTDSVNWFKLFIKAVSEPLVAEKAPEIRWFRLGLF